MNTDTAITMLLAMGVAAVVSFLATPMVKNLAYKVGAIDVPKDNRRMHKVPIPRLGGLAIFLAFLLSVLVFAKIDRQMQGILLGATMIVVLGVMDDIMALNALPKLIVQILAAGIAVYHGCVIQFVSIKLTAFVIATIQMIVIGYDHQPRFRYVMLEKTLGFETN